jgi:VIT1/CCC1 family predicted Fe2+/Mn2+ transporter
MTKDAAKQRPSVLDPVERVSEVVFGVLMALTFTGSLSVASTGHQEIRTLMLSALGCNLAWGLTDAVMYLVGITAERQRNITLLRRLQKTQDARMAQQMIADTLPELIAASASPQTLEALRQTLVSIPAPRPGLGRQDYAGAFGVFALVVLATFPVAIPFLFVQETALALRLSNLLAVTTLFVGGGLLGRYAGGIAWRYGAGMAAIGVVLVAVIIALGG